jgi:hypothetical protein
VSRFAERRQGGAALVVGLVLLLVLTLLAVSTMRTASLELLMAGNAQYRENAFRLAEAGIADALGQASAPGALVAVDGWTAVLATGVAVPGIPGGSYDTTISYLGSGKPYSGYSADRYEFLHYRVDATGRMQQRGARSFQSQGLLDIGRTAPE